VGNRREASIVTRDVVTPVIRAGLDRTINELSAEFRGVFSPETVAAYVEDSFESLHGAAGAPALLPLMVERLCRERLRALAWTSDHARPPRPQALFVCSRNAGRSQLAAALLETFSGGEVGVWSAGTEPSDRPEPVILDVLAEIGIKPAHAVPKPLSAEVVALADVVISMGCGDACPIVAGKRYEDWDVPDPALMTRRQARRLRYDVAHRVLQLLDELLPGFKPFFADRQ
jgi:arsenate reductase (thioredoxin)